MRFSSLQNALNAHLQQSHAPSVTSRLASESAQRAWHSAIVAMDTLLQETLHHRELRGDSADGIAEVETVQGLIFSGPVPIFNHPQLQTQFQTCLWVPKWWTQHRHQLLPSPTQESIEKNSLDCLVPIPDHDPILTEQFCLILTQKFSWFALLTPVNNHPEFYFSFSFVPSIIQTLTTELMYRVEKYHPALLSQLQRSLSLFPPTDPHYSFPERYSRLLISQSLQAPKPSVKVDLKSWTSPKGSDHERSAQVARPSEDFHDQNTRSQDLFSKVDELAEPNGFDIELLKAIAHEVRTPLSTIQTLTRLLLKRKDLPQEVMKRLNHIQQECVDQIDRFSLIFRAIELTTTPTASLNTSVTSISLQQIFEEKIERWTSLLKNRSLEFQVDLPENFPPIAIRDPIVLDQVLTGLIEQLSHTLPFGSQINLLVSLAGNQLKIQLQSSIPPSENAESHQNKGTSMLRAVGQLLMLQPDTGGLSLSLPATKQIFKFLGGKLTVRQSPPQGEIMTMFLPLSC